MRSGLRVWLVLASWLLVLPGLAGAQPAPWTAVGSSGSVVPSATSFPVHTLAGPFLTYGVVSTDPITAYYNVTAVAGPNPPWTRLEMNAVVSGAGAQVNAALYRSKRCGTGMPEVVCKLTTDPTLGPCYVCPLPAPLDFNNYEYYVMVDLQRSSSAAGWPSLRSLRIE
jgi:hypothetical protein